MNKIKFTAAAVALAMLAGTTWFYKRADGKEVSVYHTAPVTRATLKSTVVATGALQAVRTVQVGTQVSGQVSQISVDFNDKVKKGELLARIDPTLQQQAVQDAQAQLEKAQATLAQAQDDYTRNKSLLDARVIAQSEFSTYQSNFSVQQATVKSAQIALDRAKQQLAYTNIYAPIDGVIVERNVDVGQTVAASLSAPQLFLIANDLSAMQILASVDESDIGQIKDGQPVQFTVQSYPGQTFTGSVQQVRLQSTTTDNVVNYTAVVNVQNVGGKLLPGMTATVSFQTAEATNVLTVPNAALRIKPTDAMTAEVAKTQGATTKTAGSDSTAAKVPADSAARAQFIAQARTNRGANGSTAGSTGAARQKSGTRSTAGTLWFTDSTGALHEARVRTGLTDGQRTQIDGKAITEGMQVITSVGGTDATTLAAAPASNPFAPGRSGGPGAAVGGGGRGR